MEKPEIIHLLEVGEFSLQGQFVHGSNYTFLGQVTSGDSSCKVVYKPSRGELPLWDFPENSLAKREVAAYRVSELLGWDLVPPTVLRRRKLPYGSGSIQYHVEHDPNYHYFSFSEEDRKRLDRVVAFDLIINNADRKGSHVMVSPDGHLWCIDHGLCFHVENKLRSVIWHLAGEEISPDIRAGLLSLIQRPEELVIELKPYLLQSEIKALIQRAKDILICGVFPHAGKDRRMFPFPPL